MLLGFFRINDPYRLLGLLVIMIMISLLFIIHPAAITQPDLSNIVLGEAIAQGKIMYSGLIDSTAPVAAGIFGVIEGVFGRSMTARQIAALLVMFFQAAFFGVLLINNKAYNDSTYVPSLIFSILCFFSFDMFSFSPELLASTVLLFALNFLFKEVEFRHDRDEIVLNLGICLGVATLIIFSYVVYLFATIVILFIFTRPSIRKVFLLLFGFILPQALVVTFYFFFGGLSSLWTGFYLPNFTLDSHLWLAVKGFILLSSIPLVYFVLSLFMVNKEARFTKYQSQLLQVMFLWMLAGVLQLFVSRELAPHSLIIFIPSFAYFISHYLLLMRRKMLAEVMLWLFLTGIISVSVLARFGKIESINYSQLLQKQSAFGQEIKSPGMRVMLAVDDPGIYLQNYFAGSYLNWNLSKEILEHPDYYDNVTHVYNSFRKDEPEIIVDPNDLMKGFFDRIPELRGHYRRDGNLYRKTTP